MKTREIAVGNVRIGGAQPLFLIAGPRNDFSGPGLSARLRILAKIKRQFNLPILADVHEVGQVAPAAKVCDVLEIPAFLARQTDVLVAAGNTGRARNGIGGQFLSRGEMTDAAAQT